MFKDKYFSWFFKYGICNDIPARKNRITGAVQMHWDNPSRWINFDSSHWPNFKADEKAYVFRSFGEFARKSWEKPQED